MDLGLQLYTLREQLAGDLTGTLARARDAGFAYVEAADTERIGELHGACDELGLGLPSTFYNWTAVTGNADLLAAAHGPAAVPTQTFPEMVDAAGAAGCETMVFGYMLPAERATADDYRRRADEINGAAEQVAAAGMAHCYHHHAFEFAPLDEAGTRGWDILRERLDASLTAFEVDVFWAEIAGVPAAGLLRDLGTAARLVHLKDLGAGAEVPTYDEHAVAPARFRALGEGTLDLAGIVAAAREVGVRGYVVEQDYSPAPLADVARSVRWCERHVNP